MIRLCLQILLCTGMLFSCGTGYADEPEKNKVLRVAAVTFPPFVYYNTGHVVRGIAVEFFEEIARRNQWPYKIIPVSPNVDKAIEDLAAGHYDILIGPISITQSRIRKVSFSRPFFLDEARVAINRQSVSPIRAIIDLMKAVPIGLALTILILLLIVSHIIWLFERKKNSEMPIHYIQGIIFSSWVFVTHFFKGGLLYRPKSFVARFILMVWLVVALSVFLIATSTYTAYITAKVVDSRSTIESSNELRSRHIAYIEGQNYAHFPEHVGAIGVKAQDYKEALLMVQNKEVFGAIGGRYILESELKKINAPDVVISSVKLKFDEFAFAFPVNSPYLRPTNITLVEMQDSEEATSICKVHMGEQYIYCQF